MADPAGPARPDMSRDAPPPEATGFFALLRALETPGNRFGRAGSAASEPARLGQRARLAIATRDIAGYRPSAGGRPPAVDVEVLGLFGPEGALPLHLTRWVLARQSQRWFDDGGTAADTTFLDFCNLLQHRMLALYWRAWADARPEVAAGHGPGGRAQAMCAALAGIGLPGLAGPGRDTDLKLRHATGLAAAQQAPERLTRLLSDLIGAPVRLVEFVGHWLAIPPALQSRLGRAHALLGRGAVAGALSFQRQGRAELRVGPVGLDLYLRLVADPGLRARLRHAIRFAAGEEIAFDLRPVLASAGKPAPRLGEARLGHTLWLPSRRERDGDDLRQAAFTGGIAA